MEGITKISGVSIKEISDKLIKLEAEFKVTPMQNQDEKPYFMKNYLAVSKKHRDAIRELGKPLLTRTNEPNTDRYRATWRIDSVQALENVRALVHIDNGRIFEEITIFYV